MKIYILLYPLCFWNKILSIQYFFLYIFHLHMRFQFMISPSAEAVVRGCSVKKVFLKLSQNSQENTCVRASFLIQLQAGVWQRYFPVNFAKFLWTPFLQNTSGRLLLHQFLSTEVAFDSSKCSRSQMFFRPEGLQLYWKETATQVFSCEYCKIFKKSFFYRTPLVAAFSVAPENGVL